MIDLKIEINEKMPRHMIFLTAGLGESGLRVSLSPEVEAFVLLGLNSDIAEAVAGAIDAL